MKRFADSKKQLEAWKRQTLTMVNRRTIGHTCKIEKLARYDIPLTLASHPPLPSQTIKPLSIKVPIDGRRYHTVRQSEGTIRVKSAQALVDRAVNRSEKRKAKALLHNLITYVAR